MGVHLVCYVAFILASVVYKTHDAHARHGAPGLWQIDLLRVVFQQFEPDQAFRAGEDSFFV